MIINVFYLFFKCFVRAISNLTEKNYNKNDVDTFDMIHKNRFLLFSIVDLLNGLSVLYCFYCMADLSTNHKHQAQPISFLDMKSISVDLKGKKRNNSTVNTIKLK